MKKKTLFDKRSHQKLVAVQKQSDQAALQNRVDSFEPDVRVPVIRQRASEDEQYSRSAQPMTAEEKQKENAECETKQQMLTVAMDPEARKRAEQPFTGSVVQHTLLVAQEAEAAQAHLMEKPDWTHWHEEMYAKHLPFSSNCYKLFRRAAEGNALQDPEFVKLLLIGRMREKGIVKSELADKMAAVHVTKTQMYTAMQRDIESNRAKLANIGKEESVN